MRSLDQNEEQNNSWSLETYNGGNPSNTGIIFWRAGPLQDRLPPLGECYRKPSVSVHQRALL